MAYCRKYTLVKYDGEVATAHPLRCRCWTCSDCAKWRRDQLIGEAKAGKPTTFITLTSNPKWGSSPEYRAQQLVNAWRHIVRSLRTQKRYKGLQYLVVMEKTQSGEPHLHILCRTPYISQKWLSIKMRELTRAPIVDVRKVKGDRAAAAYVTKYVGKDPHRYEGCKRYWRSLDYMHPTRAELRAQRDPDMQYHLVGHDFKKYASLLRNIGAHIDLDSENVIRVHIPPWIAAPPLCAELPSKWNR